MYSNLKKISTNLCLPLAFAGLLGCAQTDEKPVRKEYLEGRMVQYGLDPRFPERTYWIIVKTKKDEIYQIEVRDSDNSLLVGQFAEQLKLGDDVRFPVQEITDLFEKNVGTLKPDDIQILEHRGTVGPELRK